MYSRFKHLCNRKAARTKTTGVVNLISQRQLHRTSLYRNTRVVFKVVWLLQGCLNLLYLWCSSSFFIEWFCLSSSTCVQSELQTTVLYYTLCRIRSDHESHAISVVEWYVHDNGIFTTSSADKMVRIWDTNELCVVEKIKFSGPVYTHSMASSESHCLIAGEVATVFFFLFLSSTYVE